MTGLQEVIEKIIANRAAGHGGDAHEHFETSGFGRTNDACKCGKYYMQINHGAIIVCSLDELIEFRGAVDKAIGIFEDMEAEGAAPPTEQACCICGKSGPSDTMIHLSNGNWTHEGECDAN